MILTEYDEQRHIADEKEASWEEGVEVGKLEMSVNQIRKKYNKSLPASQAARELELEESFVAVVMAQLKLHSTMSNIEIVKYLKENDRTIA